MPSHKSHLTAIARKTLPVPTRWLVKQGLIKLPCLDYGCGKCHKVNPHVWINYDPFHYKTNLDYFRGSNMTVVCNYVLCTIPSFFDRMRVLRDIQSLLMPKGTAYISVRADKPRWGWGQSERGTYQCRPKVIPPLEEIYVNRNFRVFRLTKDTELI
jgi:hypothetical protein